MCSNAVGYADPRGVAGVEADAKEYDTKRVVVVGIFAQK